MAVQRKSVQGLEVVVYVIRVFKPECHGVIRGVHESGSKVYTGGVSGSRCVDSGSEYWCIDQESIIKRGLTE